VEKELGVPMFGVGGDPCQDEVMSEESVGVPFSYKPEVFLAPPGRLGSILIFLPLMSVLFKVFKA